MEIKAFENQITNNLNEVVTGIIKDYPILAIAVKRGERVGDAISKFLEKQVR